MKKFAKRISALVLAVVVSVAALCPAAVAAAQLPDLPSSQCVVDDANVLDQNTKQTITNLNAQLENSCNGAQIGVLTVEYTGNYSTEDYATEAFNTWGIGSSSENNGVLILLVMESPEYEDGDYYLTYGDGFRNTTLDSQASAIAQTMEDAFARQDYDTAVVTCANNVANTIADIYGVSLSGSGGSTDDSYQPEPEGKMTFADVVTMIVTTILILVVILLVGAMLFYVFIAPIGHSFGWYWGPFGWFGTRPPRGPRGPRGPHEPPPPSPPAGGFGGPYGGGPYGGGPRGGAPRGGAPRGGSPRPPRSTPPRSGGSFGGGSFGGSGMSHGGGGSFGGMGGGSSHGGGGGRGR